MITRYIVTVQHMANSGDRVAAFVIDTRERKVVTEYNSASWRGDVIAAAQYEAHALNAAHDVRDAQAKPHKYIIVSTKDNAYVIDEDDSCVVQTFSFKQYGAYYVLKAQQSADRQNMSPAERLMERLIGTLRTHKASGVEQVAVYLSKEELAAVLDRLEKR